MIHFKSCIFQINNSLYFIDSFSAFKFCNHFFQYNACKKESNGYLVKADLQLIKEEKSKNHSITIKIQMDDKKFTYFTITEGKEI